jgi:hypothetical protein
VVRWYRAMTSIILLSVRSKHIVKHVMSGFLAFFFETKDSQNYYDRVNMTGGSIINFRDAI